MFSETLMCKDGDYFLDVNIQVTACQFHEFHYNHFIN